MRKSILLLIIIMLTSHLSYGVEDFDLNGQNYILIEEKSGRVLAEKNANVKLPMASTTKIMTAILAVELGSLDGEVEIVANKVSVEGSSIYLKDGERIKLEDLIYGLMLRSGNDSAIAIANHISGSEEEFVKLMNKKAKEIGALNTNFTNPHGLHDGNHYSTAYDMALITRYAFRNEKFAEIVKSKSFKATNNREYNYFINKNKTLWEYDGGDGVKIGYTTDSGRCLVASASRDNMRLIAVTLKDYNWFNDAYSLMDYGFDKFSLYPIYLENQLITQISVMKGKKDKLPLVCENDFSYPLLEEEKKDIKISITTDDSVVAPILKGTELGSIEVYLNGQLIKKDKLVAKYDILKESFFKRLFKQHFKEDNIKAHYNLQTS